MSEVLVAVALLVQYSVHMMQTQHRILLEVPCPLQMHIVEVICFVDWWWILVVDGYWMIRVHSSTTTLYCSSRGMRRVYAKKANLLG